MAVAAIGGTKTTTSSSSAGTVASGYTYAVFNSSGTFNLPSGYGVSKPLACDILTLGGGGAGGTADYSGGGGAGELKIISTTLTANSPVVVGAGGTSGTAGSGSYIATGAAPVKNYVYDPTGNTGTGWFADASSSWSPKGLVRWANSSAVSSQTSAPGMTSAAYTAPTTLSALYGTDLNGDVAGVNYYYNTGDYFTLGTTAYGLTTGISYYYSFWYMEPANTSVYRTTNMYINVNGTNTALTIPNRDQWYEATGTFTATSPNASIYIGGNSGGPNTGTFVASYFKVVEANQADRTTFYYGGGGGSLTFTGSAYASATIDLGGYATYARGGSPGTNPGATQVYSGGSAGGIGAPTVVDTLTASTTSLLGSGYVSAGGSGVNFNYAYYPSQWIAYRGAGGGGGAVTVGANGTHNTGVGGSGGLGYDSNPWMGSAVTTAAYLVGGGGGGAGLTSSGLGVYGGGNGKWRGWQTANTLAAAGNGRANSGAGGGGAGGSGGSGLVVVRYKL